MHYPHHSRWRLLFISAWYHDPYPRLPKTKTTTKRILHEHRNSHRLLHFSPFTWFQRLDRNLKNKPYNLALFYLFPSGHHIRTTIFYKIVGNSLPHHFLIYFNHKNHEFSFSSAWSFHASNVLRHVFFLTILTPLRKNQRNWQ